MPSCKCGYKFFAESEVHAKECPISELTQKLDSAKSDAIALTSECGLLRVRAQKAEGDADGNYKAAKYAQGRVDELLEINASLLLRVATSDLQVDALRRWISLYSECDCDVSKNKGMIHWFACRYVLGQKALGHAIETKGEGAENRVEEKCAHHVSRVFGTDGKQTVCSWCGADVTEKRKCETGHHNAGPGPVTTPEGLRYVCLLCGEIL